MTQEPFKPLKPDIFTVGAEFHAKFKFHPTPAVDLRGDDYVRLMQESIKDGKVKSGLLEESKPGRRIS